MVMKKRLLSACSLMMTTVMLLGCSSETPASVSVDNTVVVSEDETVSIDLPGLTGTESYSGLFFYIPEKFVPSFENNEAMEMYASPESADGSYIMYRRDLREKEDDYSIFTIEDYRTALQQSLSGNIAVPEFENTISEDLGIRVINSKVIIDNEDKEFRMTEYIFVSDKYVFTLIYMLDQSSEWSSEFEKSMGSIELK